jgi:hypothetical protein
MRTAYQVLAYLIALEVVIQSAVHAGEGLVAHLIYQGVTEP